MVLRGPGPKPAFNSVPNETSPTSRLGDLSLTHPDRGTPAPAQINSRALARGWVHCPGALHRPCEFSLEGRIGWARPNREPGVGGRAGGFAAPTPGVGKGGLAVPTVTLPGTGAAVGTAGTAAAGA